MMYNIEKKFILILLIILFILLKKKNKESFISNNVSYYKDWCNNNLDLYYINLESSKDRNIKMIKQLNNLGINYKRYNAYLGKNINSNFKNNLVKDFNVFDTNGYVYKEKKGSFGNFISQTSCWHNFFLNSNKPYLLVMEDDIKFDKKLQPKIFYEVINSLSNTEWDMIKFFHFGKLVGNNKNNYLVESKAFNSNTDNTGMQLYCLNKNSIPKILKNILPIQNTTFDMSIKKAMNTCSIYITKNKFVTTPKNDSVRKMLDAN